MAMALSIALALSIMGVAWQLGPPLMTPQHAPYEQWISICVMASEADGHRWSIHVTMLVCGVE
jgi:hypothetical protein